MRGNRTLIRWTMVSYALFLASWSVARCLLINADGPQVRLLQAFFGIVFLGITGIAIPLWIGGTYGLLLSDESVPSKRYVIGIASFALAVIVSVFLSGSFSHIMVNKPPIPVMIKYVMVILPTSAALTLQCFYLIPLTIVRVKGNDNRSMSLGIIAAAAAMGLGFLAETCFYDTGLAATMGILGLIFGTGAMLTRSVYLTGLMVFVVMFSNALADAKYPEQPWSTIATGFAFCTAVAILVGWRTAARGK